MFIITHFFNDGTVKAKLYKGAERPEIKASKNCDTYIDKYKNLEEWIEELEIELDDVVPLVIDLDSGKWVDISAYC